jgi:hypothetical protein
MNIPQNVPVYFQIIELDIAKGPTKGNKCNDFLKIQTNSKPRYLKELCGQDFASSLTEETTPGSGIYVISAYKNNMELSLEFSSNGDTDRGTGFRLKIFAQLDTSGTTSTASPTTITSTASTPPTTITTTASTASPPTTTTTTTSCDCGIIPSSVKIIGMHTRITRF